MKVNHLVWSKSEKIRYNEVLNGCGVSIPSNALRGLCYFK